MRVMTLDGGFGMENLAVVERALPDPGPGEVLVEMKAASLNYRDYLMITGGYARHLELPFVPLSDGAGRIAKVGVGVKHLKLGDRVMPSFFQSWQSGPPNRARLTGSLGGPGQPGVMQDYMVFPAHGVYEIPEHLSYVEAATFPCAGLTAWNALFSHGGIKPGTRVLMLGTGGVSIFGLQFAKLAGACAIVTSSDESKLEKARALGADYLVNYIQNPAWGRHIKAYADDVGVDVVLEVGGAGTLTQSFWATCVGGRIALIGVLADQGPQADVARIRQQHLVVHGVVVGSGEALEKMLAAVGSAKLKPVIDRVFGFEELPEALSYLASARHFGKICINYES